MLPEDRHYHARNDDGQEVDGSEKSPYADAGVEQHCELKRNDDLQRDVDDKKDERVADGFEEQPIGKQPREILQADPFHWRKNIPPVKHTKDNSKR